MITRDRMTASCSVTSWYVSALTRTSSSGAARVSVQRTITSSVGGMWATALVRARSPSPVTLTVAGASGSKVMSRSPDTETSTRVIGTSSTPRLTSGWPWLRSIRTRNRASTSWRPRPTTVAM